MPSETLPWGPSRVTVRRCPAAQASYGQFHPETLLVEVKLGAYLHATARREEGEWWMQTAVAGVGKAKGGYTPAFVVAVISGRRGRSLFTDGRLDEAAPLIAADLDDARENFPDSIPLATALRNQVALDIAQGHYDAASQALSKALGIVRADATHGPIPLRNRLVLEQARLALARGDADAAVDALRSIVPASYAAKLPLDVQGITVTTLLAQARLRQGKVDEAMRLAQDAYERVISSPLRKYYPLLQADAALWVGQVAARKRGSAGSVRKPLQRCRVAGRLQRRRQSLDCRAARRARGLSQGSWPSRCWHATGSEDHGPCSALRLRQHPRSVLCAGPGRSDNAPARVRRRGMLARAIQSFMYRRFQSWQNAPTCGAPHV